MEKFKKAMLKILFPPLLLVFVSVPVSVVLLVYSFAFSTQSSVISVVSYVISAYTLTVVCCRMPEIIKKLKNFLETNRHSKLYLTDADLRARVSLNTSLVVNVVYSVFKLVLGLVYGSFWFLAEAEYYILLTALRLWLIKSNKKYSDNKKRAWKSFGICGVCLLAQNFFMACIMLQVVFRGKVYEYPGLVVFATAAFTFYRLILSIVQTVKYRSAHNPVLSASKRLNLSAALMSLFALQTALLTQFGGGSGTSYALANSATGVAVCASVICIAVQMITESRKNLTKL